MIIKSRLTQQSSYYRLTAVDQDTTFAAILEEISHQWDLPTDSHYSLLWREIVNQKEALIIEKHKEWITFCRLHPAGKDEIVEVHLISKDSLCETLRITPSSQEEKRPTTTATQVQGSNQHTQAPAAKFAFHSVDPQPIGKRKTYAEKVREEAQHQNMLQEESSHAQSAPRQSQDEGEGEEMSAYDRVMARSRMQGEGLNQFFGTVMARRAGHSSDPKDNEPGAEAVNEPSAVTEAPIMSEEPATEEAEEETAPSPARVPRSQEEIDGMNSWLGNAWEKRLKEMGHGENSGSPYAKLRVGKGKDRQESLAPEASTSQSERRENRGSHSEEAREVLAPLQESYLSGPNFRSMMASPSLPYSLPSTRPSSRPGSASGLSYHEGGGGMKKSKFGKLLRGNKEKGRMSSFFASQPASLSGSGPGTPNGSEGGPDYRRSRKISFRSLSEALLREARTDKKASSRLAGLGFDDANVDELGQASTSRNSPLPLREERVGLGLNFDTSQSRIIADHTPLGPTTPHRERKDQTTRPTLLRAAHSAPLTSTAVNLSSVDGITLHISSLGPAFALEGADQTEGNKADLFDLMLPREIRIKCFQWLAKLHEEEEEPQSLVSDSSTLYTGKEAAVREIMRLTRVCKTWQSLLLDGQLWTSVDSSLLCDISNAALLRLTQSAGPFIKKFDRQGTTNVSSSLLVAMSIPEAKEVEQAVRHKSAMSVPTMASLKAINLVSLTHLNLQGSRGISTKALHNVLVRLPSLTTLNVSNTEIVTDDTCLLLGSCLANLSVLNVSRCCNVSGKGLMSFIQAAQGALYDKALFDPACKLADKQEDITLPLRELRAAACTGIDSTLMQLIGKSLTLLQVLDLSYVADLRDEAIAALVSHPGPTETAAKGTKTTYQLVATHQTSSGPYITLTPRQAGGNVETDEAHHRRLLTNLRHISLSSCRRLTDRSCVYLAHAVPNLNFIELANIGPNLHDEGLIKLFETTPLIQRIDLEGADEISEKVLEAVTPNLAYIESIGEMQQSRKSLRRSMRKARELSEGRGGGMNSSRSPQKYQRPPPPGAFLTHLILSRVLKPDTAALLNIVRRCPRLTHLQLDDTKANDDILKEFVNLSSQRQAKGSYISLVDCRALSRNANSDLLAQANIRPREGRRGREFKQLDYAVGPAAVTIRRAIENNHHNIINECDENLVVVKTFFNWEIRSQQRRAQQKRNQRLLSNAPGASRFLARSRRDSLGAALSFIGGEDGEGTGRWSRITNTLMGQGHEAEDARGCVLM